MPASNDLVKQEWNPEGQKWPGETEPKASLQFEVQRKQGRRTEALNTQKRQIKHSSNLTFYNIFGDLERKKCSVGMNYSNKILKLILLHKAKMRPRDTHFCHISHTLTVYYEKCLVSCCCVITYFSFQENKQEIQVKNPSPAMYHLGWNFPVSLLTLLFQTAFNFYILVHFTDF